MVDPRDYVTKDLTKSTIMKAGRKKRHVWDRDYGGVVWDMTDALDRMGKTISRLESADLPSEKSLKLLDRYEGRVKRMLTTAKSIRRSIVRGAKKDALPETYRDLAGITILPAEVYGELNDIIRRSRAYLKKIRSIKQRY